MGSFFPEQNVRSTSGNDPTATVKAMIRRRGTIKVDMRRKGFVQLWRLQPGELLATEAILFLRHTADFTSTIEGPLPTATRWTGATTVPRVDSKST